MSDEHDAAAKPTYAPNAMARIRAKKADLEILVAAGKMTREDAARELREFQSLTIAHVREHGPKDA